MCCPNCGKEVEEDAGFCGYCGYEFVKENDTDAITTTLCPNCGKDLEEDAVFCTKCGYELPVREEEKKKVSEEGGFWAIEKAGIDKGVWGGVAMMTIAVVWFFGALSFGWVFFYPPILFLIGLYAFIKGLLTG
jgi:uncharacterized membrane protein YvbJ